MIRTLHRTLQIRKLRTPAEPRNPVCYGFLMAYSGRWPLSNFGSLCKLRRTSLTKKKVEEAPNIKKEFAYSREASWACFSMRADPVFHRLSVHSSVCSVLRNTPLPFAFPPDILWADGLCRIFENEGGSTRLNSSSQFSTWLCSLWERISSWSTDHKEAWTKNIAFHPRAFGGKYILMNSNSICPVQRTENVKFMLFFFFMKRVRMFSQFIEP